MKAAPLFVLYQKTEQDDEPVAWSIHDTAERARRAAAKADDCGEFMIWVDSDHDRATRCTTEYTRHDWIGWEIRAAQWGDRI